MATLRQTWTKKNCQLKEGTARDAVWAVGEQKYAPFELRWDDFCIPYQSAFHAILCSCLLWLMWGGLEYHDNLAWAPASDKTLSLYNTRGSPAVAPSSSKSSYAASCRILQKSCPCCQAAEIYASAYVWRFSRCTFTTKYFSHSEGRGWFFSSSFLTFQVSIWQGTVHTAHVPVRSRRSRKWI